MPKHVSNPYSFRAMTAAVNNLKTPNQFLRRFLYPRHRPVGTEEIFVSLRTGQRKIAPFVRKNGEAIMVKGIGESGFAVEAPNIRIKVPMTPSKVHFERPLGSTEFVASGARVNSVEAQAAEDLSLMTDMCVNAEEYLVAQSLTGTITYEVADEEVFKITYPRSTDNNITLDVFWDDADPENVDILNDFLAAMRAASDGEGVTLTDVILGSEASAQLMYLSARGLLPFLKTDMGITAGEITFLEQFRDDGALFLGRIRNIRIWEYSRTTDVNGNETDLIRPKYAEFVTASQTAASRVLYYGAIPDMDVPGGLFVGERFSKSWVIKDPSSRMALVHSRPLPVPQRVNASVSMKVISG